MILSAAPVRRRKLYEEIVDRLEKLMLEGNLAPGDQLPSERELMTTFQVGRTAIREALFALNRMGLVSIQNGERAIVTKPTASLVLDELSPSVRHMLQASDGVRHLQDARALFEISLVRHAAQQATTDDRKRLEAAYERNKRALGNDQAFIETDVAFHYVLAEIPRNPIYTSLHSAIAAWLTEQRSISGEAPMARERAVRAHARILKTVLAGDPDAAERAMRGHLEEVSRFYWKAREAR
jgi:GntR family transcriptional regulator, sialic acid-inducible nan operon repressor